MLFVDDKIVQSEEEWPTAKLRHRLEQHHSHGDAHIPLAVLLTTGSLNPIHAGHIQCMEDAREAIQNKGYKVLAGYISPSSDNYVKRKMEYMAREAGVPLEMMFAGQRDRVDLTQLACLESDWLSCSSWECNQPGPGFADFDEVTYALDVFLRENAIFSSPEDAVFYVCGSDHYNKCGLCRGIECDDGKCRNVAVVVRGSTDGGIETLRTPTSPLVTVVQSSASLNEGTQSTDEEDKISKMCLSSTLIRNVLNTEHSGAQLSPVSCAKLEGALPPHVYAHLAQGNGKNLYRMK